MIWEAIQTWWAEKPFVRCLADALVRARARRNLSVLDHLSSAKIQAFTLSRLIRQAQQTRFGRDHDFRRIRDVADFRRLVPLCTPLDLWHAYWSTTYPNIRGVTWPGAGSLVSSSANGAKPLPVTEDLGSCHRHNLETALAFIIQARPRTGLLSGDILFVGDLPLHDFVGPPRVVPFPLRPFTREIHETGRFSSPDKPDSLATEWTRKPVTCLFGEAGRLVRFLAALKSSTGIDDLRELWPQLTAVVYSRKPTGMDREDLGKALATRFGDAPVLMLEMASRPEAPLAMEDPRHGLLRLLPHQGIFFEFVPMAEIHQPRPPRLGLDAVEPGVPYAVAVTSPAGLWACLIGTTVCFERRDPPLLRVLSSSVSRKALDRADAGASSLAVQPPHQKNGTPSSTHASPLLRDSR